MLSREKVDRDLEEELASYLELSEDEARAAGIDPPEARRHARLQLGGVAAVTDPEQLVIIAEVFRRGTAYETHQLGIGPGLRQPGLRRT